MVTYELRPPKLQILFVIVILTLAILAVLISNLLWWAKLLICTISIIVAITNLINNLRSFPQEIIIHQGNIFWRRDGLIYSGKLPAIITNHFISISKTRWSWFVISKENLPAISFNNLLRELQK